MSEPRGYVTPEDIAAAAGFADDLLDDYDPVPSLVARGVMSDEPPDEHDCRENEEEKGTAPTRSGNITVWTECAVCGRTLTPPYHDTIL